MLRRLKGCAIASCVTQSGAEEETITKKVRHLPCGHACNDTIAAERLANLEAVGFIDPDVSANLRVEGRRAKRLDAGAVEKHVPTVDLFGRSDQCELRASQLRGAALRV